MGVDRRDPVLERERELDAIDDAIRDAAAGRGRVVVVEAHAGMGKSRLLAESAERAGDALVLRARGAPLEREFPFGVALQVVETLLRGRGAGEREELLSGPARAAAPLLEGSLEASASGADGGLSFPLVHGLFWLIANAAGDKPLLLAVDDAHWADEPSLGFVAYLAGRLERVPACVLVAWRPGEPGSSEALLAALRAAPGATLLRPEPLSPAAVSKLVRAREMEPDAAFCTACAELSGGNPLLARELIAEAQRRGLRGRASESDVLPELIPEGVASTVEARLAGLPPAARALARAVAALGDGTQLRHAAALAALDGAQAGTALDALTGAGLVMEHESRLSFTHPLLGAAVRDGLTPGEAGLLHQRAARLLHDAGAAPELVAAQLASAPARGEAWAFAVLSDAAARAAREGAPASAARHLRRALEEAPDREARGRALAELGRVELALGDATGAERLREAAGLAAEPARCAALLAELGRVQVESGKLKQGVETLDEARRLGGDDPRLMAEIDASWVVAARHVPGLREAAVARVRELLERPPPASAPERVLLVAAANQAAFAAEPFDEVRQLAERGLDGGALLADEGSGGLTWTMAAAALGWADDFAAVATVCEAALDDARRSGSLVGFANARHVSAYPALHAGRIDEAAADCREALEALPDPARTLLPFTCVQLAWAELERGDPDSAAAALERWAPAEGWAGSPAYVLIQEARGRIALARGDARQALELLLDSGRLAAAARIASPVVVPWRAWAVVAARTLGDGQRARALAAEEMDVAARVGSPRAVGVALRSAGLAERSDHGLERLHEAARVLEPSDAVLERARTLVELGAAQRRSGRRAVARATLRDGLVLAERAGALAVAARAGEELETAGARRRDAPLSGPGALTPSELRVARLAAEGLTNREIAEALFVTIKAVQFHLGNIYRKLDVAGRKELPAALRSAA